MECGATLRSGAQCKCQGLWGGLCGTHARQAQSSVECAVCLSDNVPRSKCVRLRCSHVFCRPCLDKWTRRGNLTCPLCRGPCLDAFRRSSLVASFRALFIAMEPLTAELETEHLHTIVVACASSTRVLQAFGVDPSSTIPSLMIIAACTGTPRGFLRVLRRHQQATVNALTSDSRPDL